MRMHAVAWALGIGMAAGMMASSGAWAATPALLGPAVAQQSDNPAGNPAPGEAGPEAASIRLAGYNAGFRDGVNAYRDQSPYDFQSQPVYQSANQGYDASRGVDESAYAKEFRAGYAAGYHDGFYGRTASAQNATSAQAATSPSQAAPNPVNHAHAASTAITGDTLPAGTTLHLKLNDTISAASSRPGDQFTATVASAVYNNQGTVLVPQGSTVIGTVQSVQSASGVSGESQIQLGFETLRLTNGSTHPLRAQLSQIPDQSGVGGAITGTPSTTNEGGVEQSRTRRTVGTAAAGGAVGALLGALAGGGKGAGIGGIVGAGLGVVLSSRNGNLTLNAGSPMTIRLNEPVQLH